MIARNLQIFAACLIGFVLQTSQAREWTNAQGKKIVADLIGVEGDDAVLKMGDKNFNVAVTSLSEDDQAFIAKWQKENATPADKPGGGDESEVAVDNWDADWPKIVSTSVSPEIEVIREDAEGYVYGSEHYEFHCDVKLSTSLVKKFAVLFEATNQFMRELPLSMGKAHRKKHHKILLFETKESYVRAGGPPSSAGVYMGGEDVIMVPLTSLGVKKVGSGYMVDHGESNKTLPHEITHQLTDRPYYGARGWFTEGLAEYVGTTPYRSGKFQVDSLTSLKEYVTAYGKDGNGGRAIGEEINMPGLKDWMTQSYNSFLSNPQVNYGVGALVTYYFFHMDGEKDAARAKAFLKGLKEGKKGDDQFTALLDGRTWDEMAADITKGWRSRGVKINWRQ